MLRFRESFDFDFFVFLPPLRVVGRRVVVVDSPVALADPAERCLCVDVPATCSLIQRTNEFDPPRRVLVVDSILEPVALAVELALELRLGARRDFDLVSLVLPPPRRIKFEWECDTDSDAEIDAVSDREGVEAEAAGSARMVTEPDRERDADADADPDDEA